MSTLNITQPLGIWSIMATFLGDVQYTQVMGHIPTPVISGIQVVQPGHSVVMRHQVQMDDSFSVASEIFLLVAPGRKSR